MVETQKFEKEEVKEIREAIEEVKKEDKNKSAPKKSKKENKVQVSGVTIRGGEKVAIFRIGEKGKYSYETLPV